MFGRFTFAYSILLTTVGAIFSFTIAPFTGMHWYHWLIGGLCFCILTVFFACIATEVDFEQTPGAARFWPRLFTLIVPPSTVYVMSVLPLSHVPLAGWLVPGLVLAVVWFALVIAPTLDEPDETTYSKPVRRTTSTPAPTIIHDVDPTSALTSRTYQPDPRTSHEGVTPSWRAWQERKYQIERSRRQR